MLVFKASSAAIDGLCFTPDGRLLATGSGHGVTVWDVTGVPKAVRSFPAGGTFCSVAVSPCGRFMATGGRCLGVFDLATGREEPLVASFGVISFAFAPDGTEFATPGYSPHQWAVPSWEVIRAGPPWESSPDGRQQYCTGVLAYTPDSRSLGVSFAVQTEPGRRYDWCVMLFDCATGARTGALDMPFGHAAPTQIAFRPDGAVVAGNYGPVVGVVSVASGDVVARIKAGTKHITGIAFTPDGSKLIAVSNDARVRVYDAHAWTEVEGYEWKVGKLRSVAVAPDGLRMAAGSGTGKVVIWDVG